MKSRIKYIMESRIKYINEIFRNLFNLSELGLSDALILGVSLILLVILSCILSVFLPILLHVLELDEKLQKATKFSKSDFIQISLTSILSEEWQADLNTLRQRWIKKGLSSKEIRFLTDKHLFHAILGSIIVKIENYWLPKHKSEQEIE